MKTRSVALLLACFCLFPMVVRADEDEAVDEIPPLATDEEAEAALDAFKEGWKARGLRGDERTAVRELAMRRLAQVQHADIADRLYKLTRDRNEDIKTLAVMYLGEQRALPGHAGPLVVRALEANTNDPVFVMFAIESIETLNWRGAEDALRDLLAHKDQNVQKVALLTIGDTEDVRLIEDLLALMKELKIDAGVKWEGGEVHYDTGAPGTHDQEMAEKIYKEKYGNNARAGRKAGRAMRDMRPILLEAMKRLTGQEFVTTKQAREWYEANLETIQEQQKALNDLAAEQRQAARGR
ncbi:MAG: HEAT repeat domain-containing protein [Planctomycetota bacterium]|jgi:HEAT repeat protein